MHDDPIIRSIEATGYPPWIKDEYPICPICGARCDTIYKDGSSSVVGCEECISTTDAWEEDECFPERNDH